MNRGFLRATLATLLLSSVAVANDLPDDRDLERIGLTTAWWGQAVVDASQDEIEYLIPDEQIVLAQSRQGLLTAFRADTGRILWSVLLGGPGVRAFPAVMNDVEVVVTAGVKMFSLDKTTGVTRWELRLPSHPSCTPEIDENQVYIGTVDGSVYAYDLRIIRQLFSERKLPQYTHFAQVWRYKTPLEVVSIASTGTIVNFVSRIGSLYGVEARERKLRYQLETNAQITTPLGRGADTIYLASLDARMLSLDIQTGHLRWIFTSGTPILKQPRVIGNSIYVSPSNFGLFALEAATGGEQWRQLRAESFLASGEKQLYATDALLSLLAVDRASGRITGRVSMRQFTVRVPNELTDRIFMATPAGLVVCIHERGQTFPIFHKNPDRRPITPDLAPDEGASDAN
jgi:outer membrane protein assembly factor BamB